MTTTLTDRYVHAVTRSVPEQQRAELDRELRASLADLIEARTLAGEDAAAAERAAVEDLGDPARLAAEYTDRPLHLIGPTYFLDWWRLLTRLWLIVVPIAFLGVLAVALLTVTPIEDAFGTALSVAIAAFVHLGFWTTLTFAIIERSAGPKAKPLTRWSPDLLPELAEGPRVTVSETVFGVVGLLFFAGAMIWQQFSSLFTDAAGTAIPLLDPQLWSFWIPYFFVLIAFELAYVVVTFVRGRVTWDAAVVNVLLNAGFAVPALWLLHTGQLLNPAFVEAAGLPSDLAQWGLEGITITDDLVQWGVIGITITAIGFSVWDVADGFVKAFRARRR